MLKSQTNQKIKVAVLGATGLVGKEILSVLEDRKFPVEDLVLMASEDSAGEYLSFNGKSYKVDLFCQKLTKNTHLAFFATDAEISKEYTPPILRQGTTIIDNSSAFRMHPEIPLVIPEVNPHKLQDHKGIIANPNCSTIQMLMAVKPIHDCAKVKRLIISTYQSVSGSGREAMDELRDQVISLMNFRGTQNKVFPHRIAFNCLPQVGSFCDNGFTEEEFKLINETKKILEDDTIAVSATTVRIPVFHCHSMSVNIETKRKIYPKEVREILSHFPGVKVIDQPTLAEYPQCEISAGTDEVYVGRIREDLSIPCGLNIWVVTDNLRKGAATNAVQIAEHLLEHNLIRKKI